MNKSFFKTPKFIIGDNPLTEELGTYITHMRDPVFFAEIFEHESQQQQSDFHDELIKFQEETGASLFVGRDKNFRQPFTLVFAGYANFDQEMADEIAKIMRRMADWYQQYIIWEDENS